MSGRRRRSKNKGNVADRNSYIEQVARERKIREESAEGYEGPIAGEGGEQLVGSEDEPRILKCPHGVPRTSTCALCDPKKFREENG